MSLWIPPDPGIWKNPFRFMRYITKKIGYGNAQIHKAIILEPEAAILED